MLTVVRVPYEYDNRRRGAVRSATRGAVRVAGLFLREPAQATFVLCRMVFNHISQRHTEDWAYMHCAQPGACPDTAETQLVFMGAVRDHKHIDSSQDMRSPSREANAHRHDAL
jgi:hypothetical protein